MQDRYCLQMVACDGGCGDGTKDEDTGWLDIVGTNIATDALLPTPGEEPIKYRRIGKVVFLQGSFNFKIISGANKPVCILPEGYRPKDRIRAVVSGLKDGVLQLAGLDIVDTGNVSAHSIVNWVSGSIAQGEATIYQINISFPID